LTAAKSGQYDVYAERETETGALGQKAKAAKEIISM
jgi:hypothetical protein